MSAASTQRTKILLSPPDLRGLEQRFVLEALDSGWIAPAGPHLEAFEEELARITGRQHCVAVSSGTAAMHLCLLAVGVGPADEVLCPTLTFIGGVGPVCHIGAAPVFIDSETRSWNIDPDLLEAELAERAARDRLPRAVIAVDLYGITADYAAIGDLCEQYGVPLIEDAAEALGATFGDRPAGSFGAAAILSFNGNKIVTSSGGGALLTDNAEVAERARYLATQARQPTLHYEHTEVGFNYRMSNVVAALGHAQLMTLDERVARRRELHHRYREELEDLPGCEIMTPPAWGRSNHWLTCLTLGHEATLERDGLVARLARRGIEARPVWKPMHAQPVFAGSSRRENGTAMRLFASGACLPSGSGMTDEEHALVIAAVREALTPRAA